MDALGLTGIVDKLGAAFNLDGFKRATGSLSNSNKKVSSYPKVCKVVTQKRGRVLL